MSLKCWQFFVYQHPYAGKAFCIMTKIEFWSLCVQLQTFKRSRLNSKHLQQREPSILHRSVLVDKDSSTKEKAGFNPKDIASFWVFHWFNAQSFKVTIRSCFFPWARLYISCNRNPFLLISRCLSGHCDQPEGTFLWKIQQSLFFLNKTFWPGDLSIRVHI